MTAKFKQKLIFAEGAKLVVILPYGTKRTVIVPNTIYKQHVLPMEEFRESIEYMLQNGEEE